MQAELTPVRAPHNRLLNVDALRAVCAFAVLFFHFGFRGSYDGLYVPLVSAGFSEAFKFGQFGVLIFFCISGFVIAYSSDRRSPLQFAISRFSRIYPTFIVCLTLVFAAQWFWGASAFPTNVKQYLANFALLPQVFGQKFQSGVYWSIVVEVVFYAWVFLLITAGVFQKHRLALIAVWLLFSACNEWWLKYEPLRMVFLTEFASFFSLGILLHMRLVAGRLNVSAKALAVLALALCFGVVVFDVGDITTLADVGLSEVISLLVFCSALGALVMAVYAKPIARASVLVWCGGISYPLYLLHEGLGQVAIVRLRDGFDGALLFAAMTLGVTAIASAVWWFFDRPAVPWTRRTLEGLLTTLQNRWQPMRFVQRNNIVQRTKI